MKKKGTVEMFCVNRKPGYKFLTVLVIRSAGKLTVPMIRSAGKLTVPMIRNVGMLTAQQVSG
ncbi:MAG: hypothetical protein WD577_04490 [Bacteroidales bacterium]